MAFTATDGVVAAFLAAFQSGIYSGFGAGDPLIAVIFIVSVVRPHRSYPWHVGLDFLIASIFNLRCEALIGFNLGNAHGTSMTLALNIVHV